MTIAARRRQPALCRFIRQPDASRGGCEFTWRARNHGEYRTGVPPKRDLVPVPFSKELALILNVVVRETREEIESKGTLCSCGFLAETLRQTLVPCGVTL